MSETTQYTPEEMLELARAAMPNCHWIVNPKGGVEETSTMHGYELLFDPLTNPAHAWAVEQWLFGQAKRLFIDRIEHVAVNYNGEFRDYRYRVIFSSKSENDPRRVTMFFDTNLAAALAVLRRMKETARDK